MSNSLAEHCLAEERGSVHFYGTISQVEVEGDEVVIRFKGMGKLYSWEPAMNARFVPLALYDTEIQLKLDYPKMLKYIKFRYLEWLTKEEAIAHLKKLSARGVEVRMTIWADSLSYSTSPNGFRVSRITGTLRAVSEWTCMFKESILEREKDLGIDYQRVMKSRPLWAPRP